MPRSAMSARGHPLEVRQAGRVLVGDPEVFQSRDESFSDPDQKAADGIALLVMDP